MTEVWVDLMGWIGAALLLIPYYLVSSGKIEGKSVPYQMGNVLGGTLLIVNSLYYGALPSVFVNVVWVSIGLFTLWTLSRKRRGHE